MICRGRPARHRRADADDRWPSLRPCARHGRASAPNSVQVGAAKRDVIVVRVRTCRHTPNGYVCGTYSARRSMELRPGVPIPGCYFVPIEKIEGRACIHLRLAPARNNQEQLVHWAADYRLGAIAQLGERSAGQPKGRGFESPLAPPQEVGPARTAAETRHSSLTVGCLAHEVPAGARPRDRRTIVRLPSRDMRFRSFFGRRRAHEQKDVPRDQAVEGAAPSATPAPPSIGESEVHRFNDRLFVAGPWGHGPGVAAPEGADARTIGELVRRALGSRRRIRLRDTSDVRGPTKEAARGEGRVGDLLPRGGAVIGCRLPPRDPRSCHRTSTTEC